MSTPFAEVIHFGNSDVIMTSSAALDDGKSHPDATPAAFGDFKFFTFLESEMLAYDPNATITGDIESDLVVSYYGKNTRIDFDGGSSQTDPYIWYNSKEGKWYTEKKSAASYGSIGNLPY